MNNFSKHTPRYMIKLLSLLLFLFAPVDGVQPVLATEALPVYRPDFEYYLKTLEPEKKQGFIKEEIKKYRSYPHLDRAYRLQKEKRLNEARKEFDAYLALVPQDTRSRIAYLMLLDKMSLYSQVITQSDFLIRHWPDLIPAYFFKGLALQKQGNLDSAYTVFSTAAAIKSIQKKDRIFALSMATELAISRANYENAGKMLQALTEIEKKHSWYMKTGFIFEKSNRLKEALEAYQSAQEHATSSAEKITALLALAETAKKTNNTKLAQQAYETVITTDNRNRTALLGLANLAYHDKHYDKAEKWLLQLEKYDFKAEDREFLANLHLIRQNYASAVSELKQVVTQTDKKTPARTLITLAQTLESMGRFQESAAVYKSLLVNIPENGTIYLRYASLLIKMEKFDEAEPLVKRALSLELSSLQRITSHRNLALIYEKSGRYDKAVQEFEKSLLNQPPPGGDILIRRALLLGRAQRTEEALRYLDLALSDPNLPDQIKHLLHREQSVIFENAGQTPRAIMELEKVCKSGCKGDAATSIRLAVLLNKEGRYAEALPYLDQTITDPSVTNQIKQVAFREKGFLFEKTGHHSEAALEYEKAISSGDNSPGIYLTVANLYISGETPEKGLNYLQKVRSHPALSQNEKCSAEDGFGMYAIKTGRPKDAIAHYAASLQQCGENWQRRYYLGLAHYRAKQWDQALSHFTLAERQKAEPLTRLGIALCHKELNRPGAAIHYLLLALQSPENVNPEQLKQMYDTLGHLYAEEHSYDKAANAFIQSLTYIPDQLVTMKLASVLHRSGKTDEAIKTLSTIDTNFFSLSDTIEYNDLKADLLQKSGRPVEALALLEKNQKLQETPARNYTLGLLYKNLGQSQKALDHFLAAFKKEPQHNDYALALGYAYTADKRFTDAIEIFEAVARRTLESSKIFEQLGYLNATIGKNEEAVDWFKKALDSFPVMPLGTSEEVRSWEKNAHRIRSEITKLTKTIQLALYASYRTGKAPYTLQANGELTSGGLNGQIGLETSYRPPGIGLYNDRILELFGRVFGNLNPNSLKYNDDSTQAGIGLRYKFLPDENLWISAEKLIRIGNYAQNDWLLRLLYSRGNGFEPQPFEYNQDYYLLYGEVDGYLRSKTVAVYGEGRKGRAFTFMSKYMLAPYLVMDARWQSPFAAGGNYVEGGAGLSLKYFFNSTKYENYRNVADFSINYKHGLFFNRGFENKSGEYDSALFNIGFFY